RLSTRHLLPTAAHTPERTPDNTPPGSYATSRKSKGMGDVSSPADLKALLRSAQFKLGLAQRDRACVVTGSSFMEELEGSHVVPFGRGTYVGRLDLLPPTVARSVRDLGGIDSVRNGLLLESNLSSLFDKGAWGIVPDMEKPGHYRAFGITQVALSKRLPDGPLHGHLIHLPEGVRADGGGAWVDYFPPAELFRFHFETSILKACGGGEKEELFVEDRDELKGVLSSESKLAEWVGRVVYEGIEGRTAKQDGAPI
ncbi:hypothetical protein HK104_005598, partial [Borealophlyctis nickersoniae]